MTQKEAINHTVVAGAAGQRMIIGRYNLRDYGGYSCRHGGRVACGKLFRSAELGRCRADEAMLLENLGIKTMVDLRNASETGPDLPPAHPAFSGRRVWLDEVDGLVPHAMRRFAGMATRAEAREALAETYRAMISGHHFLRTFGMYIEALGAATESTLVHCFAGKDRTGLAVALFHTLLGVHRDDAIEDFLLTNAGGESRKAYLVDAWQADPSRPAIAADVLDEVLSVRAEYLEGAFSEIAGTHKSPAAFLSKAAGVDEATRERIVHRYVV